ncbi:MAG TPA: trimeric intracellular cation channel family protein [bacterium]|nr:trimeric intracellular cation channel family protein [bacterium]
MSEAKHRFFRTLTALDLAGILIFALEGGMAAIHGGLDLLGLLVLAFATALGGGIVRDLLIGAVPPATLRDWRYPVTAFVGGIAVFFLHRLADGIPPNLMLVLDAVGLATFAVAGAQKSLDYGIHPFIAILMGGVTAVGGGAIRDMMLVEVPMVLRSEVYATGALAGAAVVVLGWKMKWPVFWASLLGGLTCFGLRILAASRHWNLPRSF